MHPATLGSEEISLSAIPSSWQPTTGWRNEESEDQSRKNVFHYSKTEFFIYSTNIYVFIHEIRRIIISFLHIKYTRTNILQKEVGKIKNMKRASLNKGI
jgi:hypothetical protein